MEIYLLPCRGADKDATSALNEMPLTKPRSLRAFAPVQSSLETLSHTSPACRKHHRSSDDPGSSASLLVLKHIRYAHRQQDMGLILIGRSVRPTSQLIIGTAKKITLAYSPYVLGDIGQSLVFFRVIADSRVHRDLDSDFTYWTLLRV